MNKADLKHHLAPIGVLVGIGVFIAIAFNISRLLGLPSVSALASPAPRGLLLVLGALLLLIWLPVFIAGIYALGRRGAVGQSPTLISGGVYRYVRNPMYSGLSLSIVAAGLLGDSIALVLAGGLWLTLSLVQCKREEAELKERFGDEYVEYRRTTPLFVPHIARLIGDLSKARS